MLAVPGAYPPDPFDLPDEDVARADDVPAGELATALVADVLPAEPVTPSRRRVSAPASPSAPLPLHPWDSWKALTARVVSGPYQPVGPDGIAKPWAMSARCRV